VIASARRELVAEITDSVGEDERLETEVHELASLRKGFEERVV
jgi:hypothetical protein